jgi:ribose transport system permease protein
MIDDNRGFLNRAKGLFGKPWIGALLAAVVLWLVGGASSGGISLAFLAVNATLAGFLALAGVAQMTVMASGGGAFDLSLPYVVTFSAYLMSAGLLGGSVIAGIAISLVMGVAAGLLNSLLVWKLRIPPIVATLATGYILYSLIVAIQQASDGVDSSAFQAVLRAQFGGFTGVFVICMLTLVAMAVLFTQTGYGQRLHAMGQGREAARLSGIRIGLMTVANFVISGVLAAWLGVLIATYQGGPSADLGTTYLLGSVAAVVVGGTSISGGRTSVLGTLLGAFVLTFVLTDLIVWQISPGLQNVIQGLIVIATVSVTRLIESRRSAGLALKP